MVGARTGIEAGIAVPASCVGRRSWCHRHGERADCRSGHGYGELAGARRLYRHFCCGGCVGMVVAEMERETDIMLNV